eukprot:TRINITY_DN2374_c0_g1_i6.p1 TRINITY_DN2374_c0_g1~~TRINITY_DN2374_c0_g1_i6.p1  ORF type:complete len:183 (-),score=44.80 TRINITY_DN2374_c0_g1_i6:35-583(-)
MPHGLDESGKTRHFYRWQNSELSFGHTVPTIGFNVESIGNIVVWDIGGQTKLQPLWRHYLDKGCWLIYFIDYRDQARYQESRHALWNFMEMFDPNNVEIEKIVVMATKTDLDQDLKVDLAMISRELELERLKIPWYVLGCGIDNSAEMALHAFRFLEGRRLRSLNQVNERAPSFFRKMFPKK